MLTGSQDTVVPREIQAPWLSRSPKVDRIRGQRHFWESSEVTRKIRSWIRKREVE